MRLAAILAGIVMISGVLFSLYVRYVPSDPTVWHVDPRSVARMPDMGSYLMRDGDGDAPAARFAAAPDEVLAKFDAIALASPRVTRLAGSVAAHHITYIARSQVIGFPDYISVAADPEAGGTALSVFSRLRFGSSDFGVNRKRIETWLAEMAAQGTS